MSSLSRIFIAISAAILAAYFLFAAPPFPYPRGEVISVPPGSTVREAGSILASAGAVRSVEGFIAVTKLSGESSVRAGSYLLDVPENVFSLSARLTHGESRLAQVKVTIPEGLSSREIALTLSKAIPGFNTARFQELAGPLEGYLFPDTYFFMPDATPEDVIAKMHDTYLVKIATFKEEIAASGHAEAEIITMASILEEEATSSDSRKIVSGILWKRIKAGIALQVDAVFGYILGKSGYAPTSSDLKTESPYNTYLHRGLPPGPISNPGLDAISAALEPTPTPYLYYLTGSDGVMYYARTFQEHIANQKHLK